MKALDDFVAYCDRRPLDKRPKVYARYVDIWNETRGQFGAPESHDLNQTVFALLTPWALIPTIGSVWLVVDALETMEVSNVKVSAKGIFDPHWSVPYIMDDDGSLVFADPIPGLPPWDIGQAIHAAKRARMVQAFWDDDHDLDSVLTVVEGLLP